jgi:hypothetical protein
VRTSRYGRAQRRESKAKFSRHAECHFAQSNRAGKLYRGILAKGEFKFTSPISIFEHAHKIYVAPRFFCRDDAVCGRTGDAQGRGETLVELEIFAKVQFYALN